MAKPTIDYMEVRLTTGAVVQVYDVDDSSTTIPAYNTPLSVDEQKEFDSFIEELHGVLG
jgi:hypothetical protein